MNRRTFLSIVAGTPLVFGLRELLAQEAAPDYLDAALKRMKETRRFGVVIVIPPGKDAQARLGNALTARLPQTYETSYHNLEIFVANVFICLGEARARKLIDGKPEGDPAIADGIALILLDPEGRKVTSDQIAPGVFEDPAKFREFFQRFAGGDDGSRLRNHAKEIEKTLPEDILKAVEVISRPPRRAESEEALNELRKATGLLKSRVDSIAPWLAHLSLLKENEKSFLQDRLRTIFWDSYFKPTMGVPKACLPYGVTYEAQPHTDPCPPCGRMSIPEGQALKFLSFFEK